MAHFRLRDDSKQWFKNITKTGSEELGLSLDFDGYYFCVILGLATGRRSNPSDQSGRVTDMVERFPEPYRPQQRIIAGLLIWAELSRRGIAVTEKEAVQSVVVELLDAQSLTGLSNEGMSLLDRYASGGFDALTERFEQKPYRLEQFAREVFGEIQAAVENSEVWLYSA